MWAYGVSMEYSLFWLTCMYTYLPYVYLDSATGGSGGIVAPPPGFASKSGKDANMTLNSSVNHALWNTNLGKG